jgi:hypothetical protein
MLLPLSNNLAALVLDIFQRHLSTINEMLEIKAKGLI